MPRRRSRGKFFSRRVFIHRLTFFGGGVVLIGAGCKREPGYRPQPDAGSLASDSGLGAHRTFTDLDFKNISAACDRIVPRDEDPGALDANVPVYIDHMLSTSDMEHVKDEFLPGTAALERRANRMFKKSFFEASPAQQDDLLQIFKNSDPGTGEAHYFDLLVALTLEGLLGDPSYGGNKDRVGWALIGFGTSEPPPQYDGVKHLHHCGGH